MRVIAGGLITTGPGPIPPRTVVIGVIGVTMTGPGPITTTPLPKMSGEIIGVLEVTTGGVMTGGVLEAGVTLMVTGLRPKPLHVP